MHKLLQSQKLAKEDIVRFQSDAMKYRKETDGLQKLCYAMKEDMENDVHDNARKREAIEQQYTSEIYALHVG